MKIIVKNSTYNKMLAGAELLDSLFAMIGKACLSILGCLMIVAIFLGMMLLAMNI